jgi:hypothetical protein
MPKPMRVLVIVVVLGSSLILGPRADAACHAFTVAGPSSVAEGSPISLTVSRDGAAGASSVKITTLSGQAEAPGDFTGINQRIDFTSETSKTVTVQTTQDTTAEPAETFSVRLSDGQGCATNPNFTYGAPKSITITDDDSAAGTGATTSPAVTTSPLTSPLPTTAANRPTITPFPTINVSPGVAQADDDQPFPWVLVLIGVAAVVGVGGLILARVRRGGGAPPPGPGPLGGPGPLDGPPLNEPPDHFEPPHEPPGPRAPAP